VVLRTAGAGDMAGFAELLARLSAESVRRRFFTPGPLGPAWELRYLETLDGMDRGAVVATSGSRIVGMARWHREPGATEAEMAVVVEDGWQHRGVGTALVRALADGARGRGVSVLTGSILADNSPAVRLVRVNAPWADGAVRRGVYEFRIELPAA